MNGGIPLKNLIRRLERFFQRNRDRGIRNLMIYIAAGNAILYVFSMIDPSHFLENLLCFDRTSILHGQVWRLLTYLIVPTASGGIFGALFFMLLLFFYCWIGRLLEESMGVFRFNAFYFTGALLMDVFGLLFGVAVYGDVLSLSLMIAFATMYPEVRVFLFGILPIKIRYLAWLYLGATVLEMIQFRSIAPLLPLANYILFFWVDIPNLLPMSWRTRRKKKVVRNNVTRMADYRPKADAKPEKQNYRHRCTVCGRTDTEYPDLEFRYCSKCTGYHCYCMEHINNHVHIQ